MCVHSVDGTNAERLLCSPPCDFSVQTDSSIFFSRSFIPPRRSKPLYVALRGSTWLSRRSVSVTAARAFNKSAAAAILARSHDVASTLSTLSTLRRRRFGTVRRFYRRRLLRGSLVSSCC